METQEQIDLYRQALSMLFGNEIAKKAKIRYHEQKYNEDGIFWVNLPRRNNEGKVILSPTGFKPFTPAKFEAETKRLFDIVKANEIMMSGGRKQ